jgi:cellulose synthase/poly-beta-1,6-N-acetylglucosamine synthase-like glycosyltransferase
MFDWSNLIMSAFLFLSLFFEIFLLLTFLENRKDLKTKRKVSKNNLPSATIVVPCFNEEESIFGTVESLLALDYPKDKLKIMIIDDGSTDNSWSIMQKYQGHPMIELHRKENGGKHTALNYAISKSKSDILGCLDADSFVKPGALLDIVSYFEDKETMAVIPSIKIHNPDNVLRKIQKVEYDWGIFLRKMFSFLDAIYVTPGPFSFFRREVFEKIGNYKHAHNTEDMEIAMRMQSHGYKIKNCHTAFVYTIAPNKLKKLYKQRLRWTHGFLRNAVDYRDLFFNKKHGNLAFFALPIVAVSSLSTIYIAGSFLVNVFSSLSHRFTDWQSINYAATAPSFSWFYFNFSSVTFVVMTTLALSITLVLIGRKLSEGKVNLSFDLIYFFFIYPFIAPLWVSKAVYNLITAKSTSWR